MWHTHRPLAYRMTDLREIPRSGPQLYGRSSAATIKSNKNNAARFQGKWRVAARRSKMRATAHTTHTTTADEEIKQQHTHSAHQFGGSYK